MTRTDPDYEPATTAESEQNPDYGTLRYVGIGGNKHSVAYVQEDGNYPVELQDQNLAAAASSPQVLLSSAAGQFAPASPGGSSGIGDVVGPASATNNAIARWDTTTGALLQNSVGLLTDAGALSGLTTIVCSSNITIGATAVVQNSSAHERISFAASSGGRLDFYSADTLHMRLDSTGDLELAQGDLDVQTGDILGAGDIDIVGNLDLDGSIFMKERASAQANVAAYGQFWVKTATPTQPWFDTDAGTELPFLLSTATITDNAVPRGDGGVYSLQNSSVLISDTNSITGVDDFTCGGSIVLGDNEVIQNASTHERINFASSAGGRLDFYSANALNMQLTGADLDIPNGDLDVGVDCVIGNDLTVTSGVYVQTSNTAPQDYFTANASTGSGKVVFRETGASEIQLKLYDSGGTEDVRLYSIDGSYIRNSLAVGGTGSPSGGFRCHGTGRFTSIIEIDEQSGPPDGTAGRGTIWVKNTSPSQLWFTRDDGTDVQVS